MSKPNPNEIGIVTIDISNGPFISPLSSNKGERTKLYIPRFKSIIRNDKLLPTLQKYIVLRNKWHKKLVNLFPTHHLHTPLRPLFPIMDPPQ